MLILWHGTRILSCCMILPCTGMRLPCASSVLSSLVLRCVWPACELGFISHRPTPLLRRLRDCDFSFSRRLASGVVSWLLSPRWLALPLAYLVGAILNPQAWTKRDLLQEALLRARYLLRGRCYIWGFVVQHCEEVLRLHGGGTSFQGEEIKQWSHRNWREDWKEQQEHWLLLNHPRIDQSNWVFPQTSMIN